MLKRQGRVIVQLKNLNGEEQQLNQIRHFTDPFPRPPGSFRKRDKKHLSGRTTPFSIKKIIKKIKKHDENTVLVDIKEDFCRHCPLKNYCKFDVVGTEYDHSIRNELENIAEQMIVHRNDCVLINIDAQRRECPVRELGEIIVTNITSQLLANTAELKKIVFEYCDLRKYDVVNMLGISGKANDRDNIIEFPTLLMFLKWLHKAYSKLWKLGQNHDFIDIQLVILDKNRKLHTHRLSIFYFYLSKMDIWTRIEFVNFLKNMRIEKPQMRQTMIADCLREYFNDTTNWSSWFYFKIPNSLQSHSNIIYDMLQMAVSVFDKSNDPLRVKDILGASNNSMSVGHKSKVYKKIIKQSDQKLILPNTLSTNTITPNKEAEKNLELIVEGDIAKNVNQLCRTDFERLSYWYNQMDEKFADVVVAMKEYYQSQYQKNMFNMNKEIENIACTVYQNSEKKITTDYNSEIKAQNLKVKKLHARYLKALKLFKSLNERFVCSTRYNVLILYYNQKCNHLDELERNFIKKRLKCCKKQLSLILASHLQPPNESPANVI